MAGKKVYKSASTGRFVSKKTVKRHPDKTYEQTVCNKKGSSKKKK